MSQENIEIVRTIRGPPRVKDEAPLVTTRGLARGTASFGADADSRIVYPEGRPFSLIPALCWPEASLLVRSTRAAGRAEAGSRPAKGAAQTVIRPGSGSAMR